MKTTIRVIAAALLGILFGILFGERMSYLAPIGRAFIMLLEMAVLPYLICSIIYSIGSLNPASVWSIFKRAWLPFVIIWLPAILLIGAFISIIPAPTQGLIQQAQLEGTEFQKSFLSFLIPENPFYDLSKNIVPAVVIFSFIAGVALIRLPNKEHLLKFLQVVNGGIAKIFHWLGVISPIGIFALLAAAAGTIYWNEMVKLQFYLLSYIAVTLILTFLVLPLLLKSVVPVGYKELFKEFPTGFLLSLTTGMTVLAIPSVLKATERFLNKVQDKQKLQDTMEVVTPLAYTFTQIGNLVSILFVFFIAFYFNHPFTEKDKFLISILGIPVSLGSPSTTVNATKFFVSQLNFPADATTLYVEMMSITKNFQAMLSSMAIYCVSLAGMFAIFRMIRFNKKWLATSLFVLSVAAIAAVSLRPFVTLSSHYQNLGYWKTSIADVIEDPLPSKVYRSLNDADLAGGVGKALQDVFRTKSLKVGYNPLVTPYVYFNDKNELVGYDIAFMYELGKSVGAEEIIFAPFDWKNFQQDLQKGTFDIMAGAIFVDEQRLREGQMSRPYMSAEIVLIVKKSDRSRFLQYESLKANTELKVATIIDPTWVEMAKNLFPNAKIVQLKSMEDFFTAPSSADAFIWTNVTSVAWPMHHPEYSVVIPKPSLGKVFFGYAFNKESSNFKDYVNYWLGLQQLRGFSQRQYDVWVLGAPTKPKKKRWSVLDALIQSSDS